MRRIYPGIYRDFFGIFYKGSMVVNENGKIENVQSECWMDGEKQRVKEKNDLMERLTDREFCMKGQCAISLLLTKLDIINTVLLMKLNRDVIQLKHGRLKAYDSVCKKMKKKGIALDFSTALDKINDLIGVRAVCAYVDDIYRVAELLKKQKDMRIIKEKDYIKNPKKSGYQSLHLILEIAIAFQNGIQWMKIELQLRTAAMDYWANLDHQLRYKRGKKEAELIDSELRQCAEVVGCLDRKMLEIRKKIDKI